MPHKQQLGFTLIEMLLVLFIISVITSVSILKLNSTISGKKIDHFIEQFTRDMHVAQINAISHSQSVTIVFSQTERTYKVMTNNFIIVERILPKNFSINTGTLGAKNFYLGDGAISKSGSILINYGERSFKITFLLGMGRFYVTEI